MNNTKIEWAEMTWNPVSGCLHNCEYCYARGIADRFGGIGFHDQKPDTPSNHELSELVRDPITRSAAPYPYFFDPTLHRYRLGEPKKHHKPRTIFVCSMADLFGAWVPDHWIAEVFAACQEAPQHRYLFLTKNPARYMALASAGKLPEAENFWYGSTATGPDMPFWWSQHHNTFVSIEPLLEPFDRTGDDAVKKVGWIVMGAMTGAGSAQHQPEAAWVQSIVADAAAAGVPVLMKESLRPIVGEGGMLREFPWED